MDMIRTNNPVLSSGAFTESRAMGNLERADAMPRVMTVQGAAYSTLILMGVAFATAVFCWSFLQANTGLLWPATLIASLGGMVLVMITCFAPKASPWLALPIAIAQGVLAGGMSIMWSMYAERSAAKGSGIVGQLGTGLVLQASLLTMGIAGGMLIAYVTRLVRATEKFKMAVVAATMGICFVAVVSMVLRMFGVQIPYLWDNGIVGIGFAGFVVVVAALNLVLDFDRIEQGAERGLPKYMEWLSAIGLLVTLVWLYVSILRLLAMLNSRR